MRFDVIYSRVKTFYLCWWAKVVIRLRNKERLNISETLRQVQKKSELCAEGYAPLGLSEFRFR